ncbi:hypothetical protein [Janibacter sp. LM]|uniref:hypothetical protein n=1 Tax=Janibacter sp. LM TaxID=3144845 RepID=UPI0031F6BC64
MTASSVAVRPGAKGSAHHTSAVTTPATVLHRPGRPIRHTSTAMTIPVSHVAIAEGRRAATSVSPSARCARAMSSLTSGGCCALTSQSPSSSPSAASW